MIVEVVQVTMQVTRFSANRRDSTIKLEEHMLRHAAMCRIGDPKAGRSLSTRAALSKLRTRINHGTVGLLDTFACGACRRRQGL